MRATVLLGVGAVAGIWASRWARRRVRALGPARLADTVADQWGLAREEVRGFVEDVRSAADERERELRSSLGLGVRRELRQDPAGSGTIV